jgi:hypothetical protein
MLLYDLQTYILFLFFFSFNALRMVKGKELKKEKREEEQKEG